MGEDKSFEKFRLEAQKIQVAPPQRSWYKLKRKLKKHEMPGKSRSINFSFLLSIAAVIIVLIASIAVLKIETQNLHDLPKGKIVEWEALESTNEYYISQDQIKDLYAAYARQADSI